MKTIAERHLEVICDLICDLGRFVDALPYVLDEDNFQELNKKIAILTAWAFNGKVGVDMTRPSAYRRGRA